MNLEVLATQWGSERLTAKEFLQKAVTDGYDGVEINMPQDHTYCHDFMFEIGKLKASRNFIWAGQCVLHPAKESFDQQRTRYKNRLIELCNFQPDFINSQTGKDFYSFDDNCKLIEVALTISEQRNIPIFHETHRGKFSFHAHTLLPYLNKFPELKITADLSHFCCVSESLLEGQEEILLKIFPYVHHIHARIGFAHGPQVNDFTAPEWAETVEIFFGWWKNILDLHSNKERFTILTEFGPKPYLPVMPFSQKPLCNQWEANLKMKEIINSTFRTNTYS